MDIDLTRPLPPGVHLLWPTIPVHVLQSSQPGPTCVIQAGIHGDEVAGVHAVCEILEEGWVPRAGRLLLTPVMNPPAYRARQRAAPGGLDLNRCFPGDAEAAEVERRLAHRFMSLMRAESPALVATLHESKKRYDPDVRPSFGQTLVYGVRPIPEVLTRVCKQMNDAAQSPEEQWETQYYPVSTSSTEVIVDAIGCVGVCVETWMGFPERRRIDMQKEVVRYLLEDFGLL